MDYIEKLDYLDEYLDDFIERTVISKRVYNEETQMEEYRQNIWLKSILQSGLKEEEYEYAFDYFKKKGITVTGYSYAYCGYFDNYRYIPHNNKQEYVTEEEKIDVKNMKEEIRKYKEEIDEKEKSKLRDKLIRNNILLITKITKKYSKFTGIDINELFGYGCIGLIEALDKYDVDSKYMFSTYAVECIEGYILRSIPNLLGFKDRNLYYQMLKAKKALDTDDIDEISNVLAQNNRKVTKKDRLRQLSIYNPLSIEEVDAVDIEDSIQEFEDYMFLSQAEKATMDVLKEYDPHGIVEKYYGLNGHSLQNDVEIAKELGYSRQHINNTKKTILKKMSCSRKIREINRESYN